MSGEAQRLAPAAARAAATARRWVGKVLRDLDLDPDQERSLLDAIEMLGRIERGVKAGVIRELKERAE